MSLLIELLLGLSFVHLKLILKLRRVRVLCKVYDKILYKLSSSVQIKCTLNLKQCTVFQFIILILHAAVAKAFYKI